MYGHHITGTLFVILPYCVEKDTEPTTLIPGRIEILIVLRCELVVSVKSATEWPGHFSSSSTPSEGRGLIHRDHSKTPPPERHLRNARAAMGPMQQRPEGTEGE